MQQTPPPPMCSRQVGSKHLKTPDVPVLSAATVVKTEAGSMPEGKVKIKLEHDGTLLDVDEDDVEKVSGPPLSQCSSDLHVLQ